MPTQAPGAKASTNEAGGQPLIHLIRSNWSIPTRQAVRSSERAFGVAWKRSANATMQSALQCDKRWVEGLAGRCGEACDGIIARYSRSYGLSRNQRIVKTPHDFIVISEQRVAQKFQLLNKLFMTCFIERRRIHVD